MFKRYFRLMFPVAILSSIVFLMYKLGLFYNYRLYEQQNYTFLNQFYVNNITFRNLVKDTLYTLWWKGNNTFNGPFWMLHLLFKGYFITIIMALITDNKKKISFVVFAILAVFAVNYNEYYLAFVLGTLLAYLEHHKYFDKINDKMMWIIVGAVLFCLRLMIPGTFNNCSELISKLQLQTSLFGTRYFFNTLGGFIIVLGSLMSKKIQYLLSIIPFTDFGNPLSFSIYLTHWPIICSVSCFLTLNLLNAGYGQLKVNVIVILVSGAIMLIAAWIYYYIIEMKICNKVVDFICQKYWE